MNSPSVVDPLSYANWSFMNLALSSREILGRVMDVIILHIPHASLPADFGVILQ